MLLPSVVVRLPSCWATLGAVVAARLLQGMLLLLLNESSASSGTSSMESEEVQRLGKELRDMRLRAERLNHPDTFVEHSKMQRSINKLDKKLHLLIKESGASAAFEGARAARWPLRNLLRLLIRALPWLCNAVIAVRWRGETVAILPSSLATWYGQSLSILPWLFICNGALAALSNAFQAIKLY